MWGAALVSVAVVGGCAELPRLAHDECGNGVVEAGEDCDGAIDATLGDHLTCASPATEHACRYTCGGGACPIGWGCGDDGVCRYGTGELTPGAAVTLPHADLTTGDVDGVRGNEVIAFGPAGARVAFGARTLIVGGPDPLARAGSAADLDGDGRVDIVAPAAFGLSVWRGESDGTFTAVGYAPFAAPDEAWFLPLRVPRAGSPIPNPDALAILKRVGSGTYVELNVGQVNPPMFEVTSLVSPNELGPVAIRADLDAPSAEDELVIAANGQQSAWVLKPTLNAIGTTPLPLSATSDGRIASADLDGDGDLDLLFGTTTATGFGLTAAYNGPQGFLSCTAPPAVLSTLNEPYATTVVTSAPQPFPLAIGDLDGDGAVDGVSPDAVFLQRSGVLRPMFRRYSAAPWREALIAKIDSGLPAVVISDGVRLSIMRQTVAGFTETPIDTLGAVTNLRSGDVDGDGYADVVFRERSTSGDRVRVVFGGDGVLEAPTTVTRATNVLRLELGKLADTSGAYDGADDLVAVVDEQGTTRAAVMPGSGDRRLGSPLMLVAAYGVADRPLGAIAGRFTGPGMDLAVVADRDGRSQLWLFYATAGAAFSVGHAGLARAAALDRFALRRLAAVDLRGDGSDELVALGVAQDGTTQLIVIEFDVTGPPKIDVLATSIGEPLDLAHGDLDRDGRGEVVIVGTTGVALVRDRQVEPLPMTGSSATIAQLDRDAESELVVLGDNRVSIYGGLTLDLQSTFDVPAGSLLVRAGDVDRDAVEDLVIGDGFAITPLFSRPQVP